MTWQLSHYHQIKWSINFNPTQESFLHVKWRRQLAATVRAEVMNWQSQWKRRPTLASFTRHKPINHRVRCFMEVVRPILAPFTGHKRINHRTRCFLKVNSSFVFVQIDSWYSRKSRIGDVWESGKWKRKWKKRRKLKNRDNI